MTVKQQINVRTASAYFDDHLSGDDYYLEKGKSAGKWSGKLAPELGLKGEVKKEAFDRLVAGLHPVTGDKLTQRLRKGRTAFFDFTCSAPKSISIVGVVGGDRRVVEAHQRATVEAMAYLERVACVRERKGADVLTTKRTYTGKIVAAHFDHDASRSLDCQLHRHFCVFNVTKGRDGKLMALDARKMYDRSQTATEVYRNALAKGLLAMGYELDQGKKGFEIRGVPSEWIERFSKRGQVIAREVTKREAALGRKVSPKERSAIVHRSRGRKVSLSQEDYLSQLQDQLTPTEKDELKALVRCADASLPQSMKVSEKNLVVGVLGAKKTGKHIPGYEVVRRCLVKGRGGVSLDRLERVLFPGNRADARTQDALFRPMGRGKAKVGVALMARGFTPWQRRQMLYGLGHLIREMEKAMEPPELFT